MKVSEKIKCFPKKLISALLILVMLISSTPYTVFAEESPSFQGDCSLYLQWVTDDGKYVDYAYDCDSDKNETKVFRLVVNYRVNELIGTIPKNGLMITVPGIRKLFDENGKEIKGRQADNNAVILERIGVDSTDAPGISNLNYEYDKAKDIFTIYNKYTIDTNVTFEGSFEIRFNISSRLTQDNFKKILKASMVVQSEVDGTQNTIEIESDNALQYSQKREKDQYNIRNGYTGEALVKIDGLGYYHEKGRLEGSIDKYNWAKYNLNGSFTEKARGIMAKEEFYFYFPKDAVVMYEGYDGTKKIQLEKLDDDKWVDPLEDIDSNGNNIASGIVKEDYDCWVVTKDINTYTPKDYFQNIVVAYPKKDDNQDNREVSSYVQLIGKYYEEGEKSLLSAATTGAISLSDFDKSNSSSGKSSFSKNIHGYSNQNKNYIRRVDLDSKNSGYSSSFSVHTEKPEDCSIDNPYAITLIDENMAITATEKGNVVLGDDDYTFVNAVIPGANQITDSNGFNITKGITIDFYRKVPQKDDESEYGNEPFRSFNYTGQSIKVNLREGLKANEKVTGVKIVIGGLTTGFNTNAINLSYRFSISDRTLIDAAEDYRNYAVLDCNGKKEFADASLIIQDSYNTVSVIMGEEQITENRDAETEDRYVLTGTLPYRFEIQDGFGASRFDCFFVVPNGLNLDCDQTDTKSLIYNYLRYYINGQERSDLSKYIKNSWIEKDDRDRTLVALSFDFSDEDPNDEKIAFLSSSFSLKITNIPLTVEKINAQANKWYECRMPVMIVLDKPEGSRWSSSVAYWPYTSQNGVSDVDYLIDKICNQSGYDSSSVCSSYYYKPIYIMKTISQNVECKKFVSSMLTDYNYERAEYNAIDGKYNADTIPEVYQDDEYKYRIAIDTQSGSGNLSNLTFFDTLENFYTSALRDNNNSWNGEFVGIEYPPKLKELLKYVDKNEVLIDVEDEYKPTVYYSYIAEENASLESGNWLTADEWEKRGNKKSDIKSVAICFGENVVLPAGSSFYVDIVMRSPKADENIKFDSFTENDAVVSYCVNKEEHSLNSNPVPLKFVNYKGAILIKKQDEVDKKDLSGAKFEITNQDESFKTTVTTNGGGIAYVENLVYGETYYITEVTAPKGYIKSEPGTIGPVTILTDNNIIDTSKKYTTINLTIENARKPGNVTIVKNAEFIMDGKNVTEGVTLAGAEFALFYAITDGNVKVCGDPVKGADGKDITAITGEDGSLKFSDLEWGDYCVKELKAPIGYKINDEVTDEVTDDAIFFTINADTADDENYTLSVKNEQYGAQIELTKKEILEDGITIGKKLLENANFGLYYSTKDSENEEDYTELETATTDSDGKIYFTDLPYGYYLIKEIKSPKGYIKSENDTIKVELFPDENFNEDNLVTASVEFYNQRKTVTATFKKYDAGASNRFVSGAEYALCKKEDGKKDGDKLYIEGKNPDEYYYRVDTTGKAYSEIDFKEEEGKTYFVTNDEGAFNVENLYWGTYYLREIKAPDAYQLNETFFEVVIDENSVNDTITINGSDDRKPGKVTLKKTDAETKALITEYPATFKLFKEGENNGIFVGEYTTENGELTVNNLDWGDYYFVEAEAPEGYTSSNERIYFSINKDFLEANLTVENGKNGIEITIEKTIIAEDVVFSHGVPIFVFDIVEEDGNSYHISIVFDENSVKDLLEKNKKPNSDRTEITLSETITVPAGCYTITERKTNRYQLDSITAYVGSTEKNDDKVTINLDENSVTVDLKNESDGERCYVEFKNSKYKQSATSASAIKVNRLRSRIPTSLSVKWSGGSTAFIGDKIDPKNIQVEVLYSNNDREELTLKTADKNGYVLQDQNGNQIEYFGNSEGKMSIGVSYTENGAEVKASFEIELIYVNRYTWQIISNEPVDGYDGTARVTGYTGGLNSFEIPSEVFGLVEWSDTADGNAEFITADGKYKVTEIGYQLDNGDFVPFKITDDLKNNLNNGTYDSLNIAMPDTVTKICDNVFKAEKILLVDNKTEYEGVFDSIYKKLTSVTYSNVQEIGNAAFAGCTGFTGTSGEFTIPVSVTEIGNHAFRGCTSLKGDLTIPDTVETIGEYAFKDCTGFKGTLTLPKTVTSIPAAAFYNCNSLTGDLYIPNSVITIGDYAFYNCVGINGKLTLPGYEVVKKDGTEEQRDVTIGSYAFAYCAFNQDEKSTKGIDIPKNITKIGAYAFYYPDQLANNFSSVTAYKGKKTKGNLKFADDSRLTTIGSFAFAGNINFTGVLKLPKSIETTGIYAFCYTGYSSIDLSENENYKSINGGVFSLCPNLESIDLGENITSIGQVAFAGCNKLLATMSKLEIPNSVTTISSQAFYRTSAESNPNADVLEIVIGTGIKSIGAGVFEACGRVRYIEFACVKSAKVIKCERDGEGNPNLTNSEIEWDETKTIMSGTVYVNLKQKDGTYNLLPLLKDDDVNETTHQLEIVYENATTGLVINTNCFTGIDGLGLGDKNAIKENENATDTPTLRAMIFPFGIKTFGTSGANVFGEMKWYRVESLDYLNAILPGEPTNLSGKIDTETGRLLDRKVCLNTQYYTAD